MISPKALVNTVKAINKSYQFQRKNFIRNGFSKKAYTEEISVMPT